MTRCAPVLLLGLGLAALLGPPPAAAQRPTAEVACAAAGPPFTYDCTIRLRRGDRPLEGAEITITADMPSMPMAHNVRPVVARAGQAPGEYEARLELDMLGEWAIRLRLGGPVRDLLVVHYEFDEAGAHPASGARRHRH